MAQYSWIKSGVEYFPISKSTFAEDAVVTYGSELSQPSSPPLGTKVLDNPFMDLRPASPLPIIVRATNGKSKDKVKEKIKLSTVVKPQALEAFYLRYAEVCKSGMQGLRKRDRSGRKKAKAKKRKVDPEKKP